MLLPHQHVLKIQVEGLSSDADPGRTTVREVTNTLLDYPLTGLRGDTPTAWRPLRTGDR
jgi:hypothetical protein